MVCAAREDTSYADRSRLLNQHRKLILRDRLDSLGMHTYPGAANFLLFRLPPKIDAAAFWQRMIVKHSIVLRSCNTYEGLVSGHFRVAVLTEADNEHLVNTLREEVLAAVSEGSSNVETAFYPATGLQMAHSDRDPTTVDLREVLERKRIERVES